MMAYSIASMLVQILIKGLTSVVTSAIFVSTTLWQVPTSFPSALSLDNGVTYFIELLLDGMLELHNGWHFAPYAIQIIIH
jgi:hypothetical protein